MVMYITKHRDVSAVLVYKFDRLARNRLDYAKLVDETGIEILSATEQFPRNAAGELMGDMQIAYSRFYSAQLSERVSDAMRAKAKQGIYPSYAPIGYLNDPRSKTLQPDPERAHLVKELFRKYAETSIALAELVKHAKELGLTTRKGGYLVRSVLHKTLSNPIYCGIVRWGGITSAGVHEPIVSQQLFDRVQDKLHGRGTSKTKHHFPFRGFLTCGYCGCRLTATIVKGKYIYYHCTNGHGKCKQPYVRQDVLAERLRSVVDNVHLPEEVAAALIEQIRDGERERETKLRERMEKLQEESSRLRGLRDKAYIDKLSEVLPEERWMELDAGWEKKLHELTREILRIQEALKRRGADDARQAFELLEHASALYKDQSAEEQAQALKILVSNCSVRGQTIEPHYRKPFDLVVEGNETGIWYAQQDSNHAAESSADD